MDKSGLYFITIDGRHKLMFNDNEIGSFRVKNDNKGLIISGNSLKLQGINFAGSSQNKPNIWEQDGNIYFGETLLYSNGKCINITANDYSSLIAGLPVAGYAKFSPNNIYNIVDNIDTAEEISFTVDGDMVTFSTNLSSLKEDNMIYGNVDGALSHNNEDSKNTLKGHGNPLLTVKYFEPIICVGESIELTFHVDSYDMKKTNYDQVGNTFTVEIKTGSGSTIRKTTYAGVFTINTPVFTTAGETWFSIRCIDDDGVGSAMQYFDVLVKESLANNFYEMSAEDLQFTYGGETYQIVPNDNSVEVGFENKAALSALFAKVKSSNEGYNGILMYNNASDNNGQGTIYYIDYHEKFGEHTFYECEFDNNAKFTENIHEVSEDYVIKSGKQPYRYTPGFGVPVPGGTFRFPELVSGNMAIIINNTSKWGKPIIFPDHFTVDLNKSTIAATQCNDIVEPTDSFIEPCVILLQRNVDTHITNGSIKGNYDGYDFAAASRYSGESNPSEHIHVIGTRGARFCSFTKLDISGSVGYDGNFEGFGYRILNNPYTTTFSNGLLDIETGEVDFTKDDMIVSSLMNISEDDISLGEIALGKGGDKGYWAGENTDYFMSFYDDSNNHISTVKTKQYYLVKIPPFAKKVRVSGFGTISQWGTGYYSNPWVVAIVMTKWIKVSGCYWHDTRSAVINGGDCVGKLYEDCIFENIAKETNYPVTAILGDFEDSRQWTCFVGVKNCRRVSGIHDELVISYCQHLTFESNESIGITNLGGLQDGFISNNKMSYLWLYRNSRCPYPHVLYDNNYINSIRIFDDYLQSPLTMTNSTIRTKCYYDKLKLKNSTNGNDEYE